MFPGIHSDCITSSLKGWIDLDFVDKSWTDLFGTGPKRAPAAFVGFEFMETENCFVICLTLLEFFDDTYGSIMMNMCVSCFWNLGFPLFVPLFHHWFTQQSMAGEALASLGKRPVHGIGLWSQAVTLSVCFLWSKNVEDRGMVHGNGHAWEQLLIFRWFVGVFSVPCLWPSCLFPHLFWVRGSGAIWVCPKIGLGYPTMPWLIIIFHIKKSTSLDKLIVLLRYLSAYHQTIRLSDMTSPVLLDVFSASPFIPSP